MYNLVEKHRWGRINLLIPLRVSTIPLIIIYYYDHSRTFKNDHFIENTRES